MKYVPVPLLFAGLMLAGCHATADSHATAGSHATPAVDFVAKTSEGPELPLAVAGHVGGLVNGLPAVAGGSSWTTDPTTGKKFKSWRQECFIFRQGRWSPGPSLPIPLSDSAYASTSNGLCLAGGASGENQTDIALLLDDFAPGATWQSLPPLPQPLEGAAGAFADGQFFVFGGFSNGKASNLLQALDVTDKHPVWKTLAPLPATGRAFSALAVTDSGLYLFGGIIYPPYQSTSEVFAQIYRYDIAADHWQLISGFELPGYGWTATSISSRQIMLTGRVTSSAQVSDEIFMVDTQSERVQSVGRMVTPACCMPAIQISANCWWLPGGEPSATAIRTARTSVVSLEPKAIQ
jgi:N-acetylneuraminic acid mutarotase